MWGGGGRERVRALIFPYFNFGLNCVYWQVCVGGGGLDNSS